jgi:hypothetical protein
MWLVIHLDNFSMLDFKAHVMIKPSTYVFRPTYLPMKVGHAMMFGNFSPNFNLKNMLSTLLYKVIFMENLATQIHLI